MASYIRCSTCGSVNRADEREGKRPICGKCKAVLDSHNATADKPVDVSDTTFGEEVLSSNVPVLVDFFATWCGACRSLEPALEAVSSRYKGKLKVAKLDVERNPENANKYQIRATPTLIVFRQGKPAEQVEGALPENQLEVMVGKHMM
jgi:thioredoxin 2